MANWIAGAIKHKGALKKKLRKRKTERKTDNAAKARKTREFLRNDRRYRLTENRNIWKNIDNTKKERSNTLKGEKSDQEP